MQTSYKCFTQLSFFFTQVLDISDEVIQLKSELEKTSSNGDQYEVEGEEPVTIDTNTMSEEEAEKLLMELLTGQQYAKALVYMKKLR